MDTFQGLEVWRRGCKLCVTLYGLMSKCRDFGYKDQVTRAALSIPSNIAEGYERGSRKDYARFLDMAKGSCGELRTQLYIGIEAGLVEREQAAQCLDEAGQITRILQRIINKLRD